MRRVLRRIVLNGGLAAVILAVVGYFLAEAAGSLLAPAGPQSGPAGTAAETMRALRTRVPLTMALWGVGLVALWEVGLYLIRGEPKPPAAKAPAGPDPAGRPPDELMPPADPAAAGNPAPGK